MWQVDAAESSGASKIFHQIQFSFSSPSNSIFLRDGKFDAWKLIWLDKLIGCIVVVVWPIFQSIGANKKFKITKRSENFWFHRGSTRHFLIFSCQTTAGSVRRESRKILVKIFTLSFSRSATCATTFCRVFPAFFSLFTLFLHSHVVTFHFHGEEKQCGWEWRRRSAEWDWK